MNKSLGKTNMHSSKVNNNIIKIELMKICQIARNILNIKNLSHRKKFWNNIKTFFTVKVLTLTP